MQLMMPFMQSSRELRKKSQSHQRVTLLKSLSNLYQKNNKKNAEFHLKIITKKTIMKEGDSTTTNHH